MDILPDLRVTIAESMEALADAQPSYGTQYASGTMARRLHNGAETLRWCAARERPSYEEMKADRDAANEEMKADRDAANEAREDAELITGELVDNIRYAASKWLHAENCATVLAAPIEVECSCGMAKMRKSVLDAVA